MQFLLPYQQKVTLHMLETTKRVFSPSNETFPAYQSTIREKIEPRVAFWENISNEMKVMSTNMAANHAGLQPRSQGPTQPKL